MSYLIKITGYDEETKQEVYSHSYYQTSEEYNEMLGQLNDLLSAYAQKKHPEWFPLVQIDKQQTQSAPVEQSWRMSGIDETLLRAARLQGIKPPIIEHIHDWKIVTNMARTKEARICRICGLSEAATVSGSLMPVDWLQQRIIEQQRQLEEAKDLIRRLYGSFRRDIYTDQQGAACRDAESFLGLPHEQEIEE